MDQIRDQATGDVVDATDQTLHELGHEFTASNHESTYPIQSTSDMGMEPGNGSPLTQDPEQILHHVSRKDDIVSWIGIDGGRTPSPLRTSPGRMTPSDEGFGPEFMELQKSADGNTSPIESELQTLLANTSTQAITSNLKAKDEVRIEDYANDDLMNKLELIPQTQQPPETSNTSTQAITSNLKAKDEVRIEDYANDDLMNKLELIPQTQQPPETCNGKRPDEETHLPGVKVKPTENENGVQLLTIPVTVIDGKHQVPILMQCDQPAYRPEFDNGDSTRKQIDSGDAAPSQSSIVIGPSQCSHPSTSGTPGRGSKRKAKGNGRAENKHLKGGPLHAHKQTDNKEFNERILKAQRTKRYHDEKKRREENLTSENTALKSDNTALKSENTDLKSENTALKSENTDLISENTALKSENTDLKSGNTDLKSENTDLKSENTDLKSENTDLKSENTDLKSENTDLSRYLNFHLQQEALN